MVCALEPESSTSSQGEASLERVSVSANQDPGRNATHFPARATGNLLMASVQIPTEADGPLSSWKVGAPLALVRILLAPVHIAR